MKVKSTTLVKCDKCNKVFDTSGYACMSADGERTYSHVEVYGTEYDLCPSCTLKLMQFLEKK